MKLLEIKPGPVQSLGRRDVYAPVRVANARAQALQTVGNALTATVDAARDQDVNDAVFELAKEELATRKYLAENTAIDNGVLEGLGVKFDSKQSWFDKETGELKTDDRTATPVDEIAADYYNRRMNNALQGALAKYGNDDKAQNRISRWYADNMSERHVRMAELQAGHIKERKRSEIEGQAAFLAQQGMLEEASAMLGQSPHHTAQEKADLRHAWKRMQAQQFIDEANLSNDPQEMRELASAIRQGGYGDLLSAREADAAADGLEAQARLTLNQREQAVRKWHGNNAAQLDHAILTGQLRNPMEIETAVRNGEIGRSQGNALLRSLAHASKAEQTHANLVGQGLYEIQAPGDAHTADQRKQVDAAYAAQLADLQAQSDDPDHGVEANLLLGADVLAKKGYAPQAYQHTMMRMATSGDANALTLAYSSYANAYKRRPAKTAETFEDTPLGLMHSEVESGVPPMQAARRVLALRALPDDERKAKVDAWKAAGVIPDDDIADDMQGGWFTDVDVPGDLMMYARHTYWNSMLLNGGNRENAAANARDALRTRWGPTEVNASIPDAPNVQYTRYPVEALLPADPEFTVADLRRRFGEEHNLLARDVKTMRIVPDAQTLKRKPGEPITYRVDLLQEDGFYRPYLDRNNQPVRFNPVQLYNWLDTGNQLEREQETRENWEQELQRRNRIEDNTALGGA